MAAISSIGLSATGAVTGTESTLSASDTFTYVQGRGMIAYLRNTTGGALTLNMLGSAAVSKTYEDGGTVNYAAGFSTTVPATTGRQWINLDKISAYLAGGTVTMTGASGLLFMVVDPKG